MDTSSSCHAAHMDFPNSFSPSITIIHHFQATSHIYIYIYIYKYILYIIIYIYNYILHIYI